MISNYKYFNNDYKKSSNRFLFGLMALVFGFHIFVIAQVNGVKEGDRVRIHAPGVHTKSIVGTVYDISSTGMLLSIKDSSLTVPFSSIERLDAHVGKKRNAGKGALFGLTGGALVGGIIGAASYEECNEDGFLACAVHFDKTSLTIGGAILGALTGAAVGALIGLSIESSKWERMPVTFSKEFIASPDQGYSMHPAISVRFSLGGNH